MGWFDDSDSDEEPSRKRRQGLVSFTSLQTEHYNSNPSTTKTDPTDDDEPDPLDAFMSDLKTINEQDDLKKKEQHTTSCNIAIISSSSRPNTSQRLDLEDDESDKEECRNIHNNPRFKDEDDYYIDSTTRTQDDSNNKRNSQAARIKAQMANTFHKAGCNIKSSERNNSNINNVDTFKNNEIDTDDDDDDEQNLLKKRKRVITPLDEKINHATKSYHPFRKQFLSNVINTTQGQQWRDENDIYCSMKVDPIYNFKELCMSMYLLDNTVYNYLDKNGIQNMTGVQAQSIPIALLGYDLLVTSPTGSGKTYGIDGPISIILTPTRELARQVHFVCEKLLHLVHGKAMAITGGMGTYEMTKELKKGCEVIVSTPGRLIDMVKKKATNFDRVTLVILDEADKMLDMGFETQVVSILDNIRPDRQTFMFSATFGKKVERVAKRWLRDSVRIAIGHTGNSSEHVLQHVLVLPSYEAKKQWILEMMQILTELGKFIIFVSSREDCEALMSFLREHGHLVDSIHGDKHQSDRNAALAALRKGKVSALVATDVASRGLDVPEIMSVVNFDPAKNLDSHIHRVGRAGRLRNDAGESEQYSTGVAYTLLTSKNAEFASVLVDAFEREGREISDDLMNLAAQSMRFRGGRSGKQKTGIGFNS